MKNINPLYLIEGAINSYTKAGKMLGKKNPVGRMLRKIGAEKYFRENPGKLGDNLTVMRDAGTMASALERVSNLKANLKDAAKQLEFLYPMLEDAKSNGSLRDIFAIKKKIAQYRFLYDEILKRLNGNLT